MKTFVKQNKLICWLFIWAIIFAGIYIRINRMPEAFYLWKELMDFFYGLALSIIAASVFYVFQVYLPERRRRKIIKSHFEKIYNEIKEVIIFEFLVAIGRQDKKVNELMTFEWFKHFFSEPSGEPMQDNWHRVLNTYESNRLYFSDLCKELSQLKSEISFLINNLEISDENSLSFFSRLSGELERVKSIWENKDEYDCDYKIFWRFLYELFSWWDCVNWQRETDIIKDMINKI